jgi:L-lactate permease
VFKLPDGTIDEAALREVALASSVALAVSAVCLVPFVVRLLVPFAQVRANIVFIELSVLACCVPNVIIAATFSYEFPTLLGGVVGMAGIAALVHLRVGLSAGSEHMQPRVEKAHADGDDAHHAELSERRLFRRLRPTAKLTKLTRIDSAAAHHHDSKVLPCAEDELAEPRRAAKPPPPAGAGPDATLHEDSVGAATAADAPRIAAANHTVAGPDDDDADQAVDPALEARLRAETSTLSMVCRTSPIWSTVLLLLLTRVEQIGLKGLLRSALPRLFVLRLGNFGMLSLSASFVLALERILDEPSVSWSYEVFYVPALLPFAVSGSLALLLYRRELRRRPLDIVRGLATRMRGPAVSLVGAIALVNMLRSTSNDPAAPATVIGVRISRTLSYGWLILAAPIGSLGSFFSGSTTVSNLTFGSVQAKAATLLGLSPTAMCAIQAVGGSFGNAICLSNIIAASTVVKLKVSEGEVMKRTGPIVIAAWVIGTVTILPFVFL